MSTLTVYQYISKSLRVPLYVIDNVRLKFNTYAMNDKTHIMCFIVTSKLQLATEKVQAVALRVYS